MLNPGRIYVGTPVRLTINLTDTGCDPVDPDTVLIKVKSPCGTITTYTYGTDTEVGRTSAGLYTADITPDDGGRWHYRWETTGTETTVTQEGNILVQYSPFTDRSLESDYA
jgi:hypothetical protein